MSALQRPVTYDDLLEMPDDGKRREVLGGEIVVNPAPTAGHQDVVGNLYALLRAYAAASGGQVYLAPFDVLLGRYNIVQPDLVYLSPSRPRVSRDQHAIEGAPDLVVEVISPGTGWIDRTRKMALYADSGIPEYWIADPVRRDITIFCLAGDEYAARESDERGRSASHVLPGLVVDPAEVFLGLGD